MDSGSSSGKSSPEIEEVLEGPFSLYSTESVLFAVVFEDLVDQLDVIGQSIHAPQIELRSAESMQVDDQHRPVFDLRRKEDKEEVPEDEDRWILYQNYESTLPRRLEQKVEMSKGKQRFRKRLSQAIQETGVTIFTVAGKAQRERAFLQDAMHKLMLEVLQSLSFETVGKVVTREKELYAEKVRLIENDVNKQKRLRQMARDVIRIRAETEAESKQMLHQIWELEDLEQELRSKKELEQAYVTRVGKLMCGRSKKLVKSIEKGFYDRLDDLRLTLVKEKKAHECMMIIIDRRYRELLEKLNYWMEKYETDRENLIADLDQMKENRAKDLARIAWLKHINHNYNQIIRDERRLRNLEEYRQNMAAFRIKTATKLQAWWRGTMVRNCLGPYRPVKPKKGKKNEGKEGKKK